MELRLAFLGLAFSAACAPVDPNGGGLGGDGGGSYSTTTAKATSGTSATHGATSTGGSPTTSATGPGNATSTTGSGPDPYNTPPTCSSMTMAVGGNNANMKPGASCQTCHMLGGAASGKTFDVSGTVYLTAHEPDDCNGVNVSNATVVITDGNNVDTPLPVNAVGNFYHADLFGFAAFKPPIHVRVEYGGKTRAMSAVATGDCDSCHTETGTQNAPGRIMLP